MIENILKRDGTYKPYEEYKIKDAIKKAFKSVHNLFKCNRTIK
jgi:ribonucleoside-triphosphate reductase